MTIELRSDTFTKPTPGMLDAMMHAAVGDDVFGEDPTVNLLQEKCASLFGMEAALFCASGTMTNQIAIKCHTQPGDEVICDEKSHIYQYEGGGIAMNSGCSVKLLFGERGCITSAMVQDAVNNRSDIHKANSKLVSLENTCNRAGGTCYDFKVIEEIQSVCIKDNLKLHLDGARVFNAIVEQDLPVTAYGQVFDSISVCLSKGLGAPVGSVLLGDKDFIEKAKRIRKVFGGAMRQAGYLAAAGIYALGHHIEKLKDDHLHAKKIAGVLEKLDFVGTILPVETNIIIFEVKNRFTAKELESTLKKQGINCIAISPTQIRLVFHLGVTTEMVEQFAGILNKL
jgi:threonine aldolase